MVTKNRGIVSLTILSCITFIGAPVQSAQPERPINAARFARVCARAGFRQQLQKPRNLPFD
jgi:hypothetical protein